MKNFYFYFYLLLFCFASPSSSMCGLCLQMYLSTYVPCSCAIVVDSLRNMQRVTLLSLTSFSSLHFQSPNLSYKLSNFQFFLLLCFGMLPCIVLYKSPQPLSKWVKLIKWLLCGLNDFFFFKTYCPSLYKLQFYLLVNFITTKCQLVSILQGLKLIKLNRFHNGHII